VSCRLSGPVKAWLPSLASEIPQYLVAVVAFGVLVHGPSPLGVGRICADDVDM